MKRTAGMAILLLLTAGLSGCIDPVVPRLPGPGDESPTDTGSNGKVGLLAPGEMSISLS